MGLIHRLLITACRARGGAGAHEREDLHVLFASDAPFDPEKGPMYIRETIAIIDRLPVSAADREKIYWRNAVELLKL